MSEERKYTKLIPCDKHGWHVEPKDPEDKTVGQFSCQCGFAQFGILANKPKHIIAALICLHCGEEHEITDGGKLAKPPLMREDMDALMDLDPSTSNKN
jgi:hypothetical protein